MDHLIEHGLFTYIRGSLSKNKGLLRLALRRFDKNNIPAASTTARFFGRLLSVPGLVSGLPASFISQELRPALVVALAGLSNTSDVNNLLGKHLVPEDIDGLVGNMLDLAKPLIPESSPELLVIPHLTVKGFLRR